MTRTQTDVMLQSRLISMQETPMKSTGAGIAIGTGIGAAIGVAMGNLPVGIAIGIAIGAAVGASQQRKKG